MAKRTTAKKPDCKSCIYRAGPHEPHECDYAFFMQPHTRKAVPKERCTHYRKGPRLEQRPQEAVQPWTPEPAAKGEASAEKIQKKAVKKYDWGLAWDLYHEQNATDREIMDALGCGRAQVAQWRIRNHLPVHPQKGRVQKRDLSETVRRIQKKEVESSVTGRKGNAGQ